MIVDRPVTGLAAEALRRRESSMDALAQMEMEEGGPVSSTGLRANQNIMPLENAPGYDSERINQLREILAQTDSGQPSGPMPPEPAPPMPGAEEEDEYGIRTNDPRRGAGGLR